MVEPYSAKKAKKPLFIKLLLRVALVAFLISPLLAEASVFSTLANFLKGPTASAQTNQPPLNSQNMPLLSPAINLDPNPAKGGGGITVVDGSALESQEGPSGTAADLEEKAQSSQISVYTVRSGDTLSDIAEMFDVDVGTIAGANNIQGRVIHPGQELIILPIIGIRHTVVKGETLASIAKKYEGDEDEIANYNELSKGVALSVGQVVIVPHGEVPITTPTPSKPSATPSKTAPLQGAGGPSYSGYYAWPVSGGLVTQGLHGYNGIDIGAPQGTAVFAAAGGTVIIAKNNAGWNGGYGNYLVIQHDNGTQTLYAHATSIKVSVGDNVSKGQSIATIGRTGQATGYHLHFEVRGAANPFR